MVDGMFTPSANVTISDMPSGTAVTEPPAQETGSESAVPESASQGASPEAGSPQGSSEDGQQQPGQRRWSKVDEIRDLRAWRREARQRETGYQQELSSVRQQLEELRQMQQPNPSKTARNPSDFWQDPEAALQRNLEERLGGLEERLLDRISMSREMEQHQQVLHQKQETAVEFIRSQPNYSQEDDEDLIDIIESIPLQQRQTLEPEWVAEWAWLKLNQSRGVGDRSKSRARASSVVGQPPGAGLSGKVWSKAEFDATVDLLDKQGAKADSKLLDELMSAAKEGRVR